MHYIYESPHKDRVLVSVHVVQTGNKVLISLVFLALSSKSIGFLY